MADPIVEPGMVPMPSDRGSCEKIGILALASPIGSNGGSEKIHSFLVCQTRELDVRTDSAGRFVASGVWKIGDPLESANRELGERHSPSNTETLGVWCPGPDSVLA